MGPMVLLTDIAAADAVAHHILALQWKADCVHQQAHLQLHDRPNSNAADMPVRWMAWLGQGGQEVVLCKDTTGG